MPVGAHSSACGRAIRGYALTRRSSPSLWFAECPNHAASRAPLDDVIAAIAPGTPIRDIDATDPDLAREVRLPGSPTIRVDGRDVDPTFVDPGE